MIKALSIAVAACLAALLSVSSAWSQGLTMLVSAGGSGRTFEAAGKHFTEKTGIPITVIQYPYAEVREKQLLELSGSTGAFDVVSIDGAAWLPELASFLEPIDTNAVDVSNLIPSMVDIFRVDGEVLAVPVRIAPRVLIYRKDLYDQAGFQPPRTWEEFRTQAAALTKDGVYGFAPALRQGNYLVLQWFPILFGHGGNILSEDLTAAAFNTPAGIKATQFLVDMVKDGLVPPGAAAYEQTDIITAISQGIAATAITYSPYFTDMNDPEKSTVSGKLAIASYLPRDPEFTTGDVRAFISGWGFGVAKSSKNKEDAMKFLAFIASTEVQQKLAAENANAPTVGAVYNDPAYLKVFPAASEVLGTLSAASDRPLIQNYTVIEDILARELSAAITGSKTVEDALSAAEADVNAAL